MWYLNHDAEDKSENVKPRKSRNERVIVQKIEIHQVLLRHPQMKVLVDECDGDLSVYPGLQT